MSNSPILSYARRRKTGGASDPIGDALRADVVAYYKFNGNANDASGNGHNGTPVNSPTYVSGKVGQAIHFDKTLSQKVSIPDHADLRNTGNLYIFGWVKQLSLPDRVTNFGSTFIGKMDGESGVYEYEIYYQYSVEPDRNIFSFLISTLLDGQSVNFESGIDLNTWYFLEAYYRASDRELVFAMNGGSFSVVTLGNDPDTTTEPVLFGADVSSSFWDADSHQDEWGILKPDIVPIASESRTYLFNSGAGRTLYP